MNGVGHGRDQGVQEGRRRPGIRFFDEVGESELRSPVDGDEQVQLAIRRAHFGDVDVEVADRIALEGLLARLVARHVGQAADAVSLQTTVQR